MDKTGHRVLTLTVGCILLLSIAAQRVIAWPCKPPGEPCDDCYTCTPTGCEWDCTTGQCCYNGTCEFLCPTGWCCDDGTCVSSCPTGECCDAESDGSCVTTCPGECKTCMSGFCKDDDNECETCEECVEGNCISCASLDKICCDGECREPCDDEIDEPICPTDWNEDCIACVGILEFCSHHYTRIFTNAVTYKCSGGCDGECAEEDPQPVCSRGYKCKLAIKYKFAECTDMSETGPVPLDCYPQEVMPWECNTCTTDYNELVSVHYPINPSEKCQ